MQDDDEAFNGFERGVRPRSVLDVEHERVRRGYPADVALQKRGADLEDEILRKLECERETLRAIRKAAEIPGLRSVKSQDGV